MDEHARMDGMGCAQPALLDARAWRERHPDADLPLGHELDRVGPGDLVALGWELPDGRTRTRWVEVLDNAGSRWIGRVDGEFAGTGADAEADGGSELWLQEFRRENVCDVWFTQVIETVRHDVPPGADGAELVQVLFALESATVDRELLWAAPLPDGTYRIESTPFFAAGVARGDVVTADLDAGGTPWATGVRAGGGFATVRMAVDPEAVENPAVQIVQIVRGLDGSGADVEVCEVTGIVSIAVPPCADLPQVLAVLRDVRRSGRAQWEVSSVPAWWDRAMTRAA